MAERKDSALTRRLAALEESHARLLEACEMMDWAAHVDQRPGAKSVAWRLMGNAIAKAKAVRP